jgi:AraC-like DNA-binding protein
MDGMSACVYNLSGGRERDGLGREGGVLREIAHIINTPPSGAEFTCQLRHEERSRRRYYDMHRAFEMSIVLSGTMERHYEDCSLDQKPGDVFLSCPWEPHGWRTTSPARANLMVQFIGAFLGDEASSGVPWLGMFSLRPQHRPRLPDARARKRVLAVAHDLIETAGDVKRGPFTGDSEGRSVAPPVRYFDLGSASDDTPPAWGAAVRLAILRVLLLLYERWPYRSEVASQSGQRANDLASVLPAIELSAPSSPARTRRVTVAEAAAACKLGATQFRIRFGRAMGVSFGRFELRRRLAHASYLLVNTDLPIDALAEQSGFADRSHLHRMFTRLYGATPGVYRTRTRAAG